MNRFLKKLPPLFVIIFITGVLTATVYVSFAEAQPSPPTLNGYELNAAQSRWVEYIAKEVVQLLPGSPDEKADIAARGNWWALKEGVLDVTSPENPIGYSNCQVTKDGRSTGNNHIGFVEDYCPQNVLWQVGIAAVQVPYQDDAAVKTAAAELHPGMSYRDIIAKVAILAGHPEGSPEYNGAINSNGYFQRSLLLRDPAIGLTLGYDDIAPCLDDAKRAALKQDWCQGYGAAGSIAKDVDTTNKVIRELASYYKNFASGAMSPTTPSVPTEEGQKETLLGLPQQIGKLYSFALGIGGLVALGVLIFGGILYTVSAGNASREDDAKQWITGSIVGLIILFGSWFILNTINPELTKLTDLKLLANKAAESLPGGEEAPSQTGGVVVIDGKACPLASNPTISDSCGFARPQGGAGSGGHEGIDIFVPIGTPLYAMENGEIGASWGWNHYGGWRFWLNGDSGDKYYYAHLKSMDGVPKPSTRVSAGEVIAYSGRTGESDIEGTQLGSDPHLHLGWQSKTGGASCGAPSRGYHNPTQLLKALCEAGVGGAIGTMAGSPELTQILNKPQYQGFGVSFQEIGGQGAAINNSKSFPSASLYKLFVAQWFYDQREKGRLSFNQKIPLVEVARNIAENNADGVSFLKAPSDPVSISECLPRAIEYSDNICGWALRDYALKNGLDNYLKEQSYTGTNVNELRTTADDIANFLNRVAQGFMASQPASEELYNLMKQQYHGGKIPGGLPAGVEVANKTGELHGSKYSHDAAIIKYNGKSYILVVLTPLDPDISSTNQIIKQLTRELFNTLKR